MHIKGPQKTPKDPDDPLEAQFQGFLYKEMLQFEKGMNYKVYFCANQGNLNESIQYYNEKHFFRFKKQLASSIHNDKQQSLAVRKLQAKKLDIEHRRDLQLQKIQTRNHRNSSFQEQMIFVSNHKK